MLWAFVDYENVGTLKGLDLGRYERVIVFLGPQHRQIKFGPIPGGNGSAIQVIQVSTSGKDNLDFHLAFSLGRHFETAPPEVEFHLVSNDKGLNGLIHYAQSLGRCCRKVSVQTGPAAPCRAETPGAAAIPRPAPSLRPHHAPAVAKGSGTNATPGLASVTGTPSPFRMPAAALRRDDALMERLHAAVLPCVGEDGWARLGQVGARLRAGADGFDPKRYGYAKLSALLKEIDLWEWSTDDGQPRLRPRPMPAGVPAPASPPSPEPA